MTDDPRTGSRRAAPAAAGPVSFSSAPTANPWAAFFLLLAGVAGLAQLLVPWRPAGSGPADGGPNALHAAGVGGWRFYEALHDLPGPAFEFVLARFVVIGVAGAGLALVLLGLLALLPIDHRPVGTVALLVSGAAVLGAVFLLARARALFGVSLNALFGQAQVGFYLVLAAGLVGLVGAFTALARR